MAKFLLVEDNADMRRVLRQMLSDLGEVYECSDGAKAFSAYAEHRPDWVLMDIKLGATSGIAATSEIKAVYPEARILMVTVYGDEELRAAARQAGACGYVLKENLAELWQVVAAEIQDNK